MHFLVLLELYHLCIPLVLCKLDEEGVGFSYRFASLISVHMIRIYHLTDKRNAFVTLYSESDAF